MLHLQEGMWYRLKKERRGYSATKEPLTLKPGTPMQVANKHASCIGFTGMDGSFTWVLRDDIWGYFSTRSVSPLILLASCADPQNDSPPSP